MLSADRTKTGRIFALTRPLTANRTFFVPVTFTWIFFANRANWIWVIPFSIVEFFVGAYKIVNRKIILVIKKTGSAANNLLKFNHVWNRSH